MGFDRFGFPTTDTKDATIKPELNLEPKPSGALDRFGFPIDSPSGALDRFGFPIDPLAGVTPILPAPSGKSSSVELTEEGITPASLAVAAQPVRLPGENPQEFMIRTGNRVESNPDLVLPSVFNQVEPEPAPLTKFEIEKQRLTDLFKQPGPLQAKVDANLNKGFSNVSGVPGNYYLRLPIGVTPISDEDATTFLAQSNTFEATNNALMRGYGRLLGVTNVITKELGLQDPQSFIENMQELDRVFPDAPPEVNDALREIQEAEGVYNVTKAILDNPGAVLSVVGESLPTSLPTIAAAFLGPFAPAGAFATSWATEYAVVIDEEIKSMGIDLQDDAAMLELLSDTAFWEKARSRAKTRAGPIAVFDALSMGIAGKLLSKVVARGGSRAAVGGALGAEVLTQGAFGGAGEAAAQRFEMYRGMKDKFVLGDVALETVGEFVPGAGEIAVKAKPSINAALENQFQQALDAAEIEANQKSAMQGAIDLLNPNSAAYQPQGELTATRADIIAEASRLADRMDAAGGSGKGLRIRINNLPDDKELTDQDLDFYRDIVSDLEATPSEIAEQTKILQRFFETKKGPSNTQAKYEKVISEGSYAPVIQQAEARLNELANQLRELGFDFTKLPTILPPDAKAIRSEMSGLAGTTVRLINRHAAALAGNKKSKGKTTYAQDADETAMALAGELGNGSLTNSGANVTGLDQPQAGVVAAAPTDLPQVAPVIKPNAPALPSQIIPDIPQVDTKPVEATNVQTSTEQPAVPTIEDIGQRVARATVFEGTVKAMQNMEPEAITAMLDNLEKAFPGIKTEILNGRLESQPAALPSQIIPDIPQVDTKPVEAPNVQTSTEQPAAPVSTDESFSVAFGDSVGGLTVSSSDTTANINTVEVRNKEVTGIDGVTYKSIFDLTLPFGTPVNLVVEKNGKLSVSTASKVKTVIGTKEGGEVTGRPNFVAATIILPLNATDAQISAAVKESRRQWSATYKGVITSEAVPDTPNVVTKPVEAPVVQTSTEATSLPKIDEENREDILRGHSYDDNVKYTANTPKHFSAMGFSQKDISFLAESYRRSVDGDAALSAKLKEIEQQEFKIDPSVFEQADVTGRVITLDDLKRNKQLRDAGVNILTMANNQQRLDKLNASVMENLIYNMQRDNDFVTFFESYGTDSLLSQTALISPNGKDDSFESLVEWGFQQQIILKTLNKINQTTTSQPANASVISQPAVPVIDDNAPDINPQDAKPVGREVPNKPVTSVQSPDGQATFNVQGRVIELADLKQATGDLQPRDRSRKDSDALAKARAGSMFNPDRLLDDPTSGSGAPIIARDGTVMSGNGRVLTMQEVYTSQPESLSRYRSALEVAGISTEGFSQPVFVRQLSDDMTVQELKRFADLSNTEAQAQMSMTERASRDSTRLTDSGIIDLYRGDFDIDAAQNRGFVNEYAKKILSPTEQGAFVNSKGEISQEGISRVKNAILASAFDNPDTLATMLESSDENIKAISSAFMAAAPKFAQLKKQIADGRTDAQFDITSDLAEMANLVSRLRREGVKLNDYYNQSDMLSAPDPEVQGLVRAFYNQDLTRANSAKAMKDFLTFYADEALQKEAGGLIPDDTSASDIIEAGRKRTEEKRDGGKRQAGLELAASSNVERNDAGSKQVQKRRDAESSERTEAVKPKAERNVDAAARPTPESSNQPENIRPENTKAVFDPKKVELREQNTKGTKSGRVLLKEVATLRQSLYDQAFTDAGHDPRLARNYEPEKQFNILKKLVTEKFGFSYVQKSDANNYNAVQSLLDAYRNLQWMTHTLALPNTAIGLDGSLGLALPQVNWGGYLAAYMNKQAGMGSTQSDIGSVQAPVVIMPGRSNSFAHEWGHALDYHLVDKLGSDWGRGVTGRIRTNLETGERPWQNGAPTSIVNAMGDLINAMFFEKAATSAKLMQLEQQITKTEAYEAKTGKTTKKLQALISQRQKLIEGSTRSKLPSSTYKSEVEQFDSGQYWTRPTEMFARVFEAYVARNVEAAGGTTEFITSSNEAYKLTLEQVEGADSRLALTYPNDPDRHNIFLAMDNLMSAVRSDFIQGNPAQAPGDYDMIDAYTEFAEMTAAKVPEGNAIKRTAASVKEITRSLIDDQIRARRSDMVQKAKEQKRPSKYPEGVGFFTKAGMAWNDNFGFAFIQTKRGNLMTLHNRYRIFKNKEAQDVIDQIIERVATDPGSNEGRITVEGGTFEEAVGREGSRFTHRFVKILDDTGMELFNEAESQQLRLLLTADEKTQSVTIPKKVLDAAYKIRTQILNPLYDYMKKNEVNVNYLASGSYMPRMMDTVLALADESRFRYGNDLKGDKGRGSVGLYADVVFQNELGSFDVANVEQITSLINLGKKLTKTSVLGVMEARKRITAAKVERLGEVISKASSLQETIKELNKQIELAEQIGEDTDVLQSKVESASEQLNEIHEELYEGLRQPYGEQMTENWIVRMKSSLGQDPDTNAVQGSFSKARTLPKQADSYLVDFYLDPAEAIMQYIPSVVRKAEYQNRFGDQMVPKGYKQKKGSNVIPGFPPPRKDYLDYLMDDVAPGAGIAPEDIVMLREIVQLVTGTGAQSGTQSKIGKGLAKLHAYGTMTLLPRAVQSSLSEPLTMGITTGSAAKGFKTLAYSFDEAFTQIRGKKAVERKLYYRQMARILGVVDDPAFGVMVANRLGGSMMEDPKMTARMSRFFVRTGLTGLTNAQRRASMRVGMQYIAELSDQYKNGETKNLRDQAREILGDFGVRNEVLEQFTEWLAAYNKTGRLPDIQSLIERGGELSDLGQVYAVAVGRITDQSIQNPKIIDRPMYAETLVGRMVYQIQSFSAAFNRNIIINMGKRIAREFKKRGQVSGVTYMMLRNASPLIVFYGGHLIVSTAREALLNPDRWEEKKESDELTQYLMELSLSRSGAFGRTDVLYNAFTSMRYEADLSNALVGASGSYYLKGVERMFGIASENSPDTVSSEYQFARGIYDLTVPTLAAYLASAPGYGKVIGFGLGAGAAIVSSPAVKHYILRQTIKGMYDEEYYPGQGGNKKSKNKTVY